MKNILYLAFLVLFVMNSCAQSNQKKTITSELKELTPAEERVIVGKGTERAFTGKYDKFYEEGTYVCKRCSAELYNSDNKFDSGCGWPSFDDEVPGAVKHIPDADGMRTEITCNACDGHLGHVFLNEGFTAKNTRHCVNSISLEFIPAKEIINEELDTAYFAGGCFWGVEFYMEKAPGVISAESGYMGGYKKDPTYREVSSHKTGHAEVVRIVFNPDKISFEAIARLFFEIHDPTQVNRQGPDVGDQYRSEVFYNSMEQKVITQKLINILDKDGFKVATRLSAAREFWAAEKYHQDYYDNKGGIPYCHAYVKRFKD